MSRNAIESKSFSNMANRFFANFNLQNTIALRWALRDIVAKRIKLIPLKDDDLQTLLELGLVEMQAEQPVVTAAGLAAVE